MSWRDEEGEQLLRERVMNIINARRGQMVSEEYKTELENDITDLLYQLQSEGMLVGYVPPQFSDGEYNKETGVMSFSLTESPQNDWFKRVMEGK